MATEEYKHLGDKQSKHFQQYTEPAKEITNLLVSQS